MGLDELIPDAMIMMGKNMYQEHGNGGRWERSKEIKSVAIKRHNRRSGDEQSTWRMPSTWVTEIGLVATGGKGSRLILYDLCCLLISPTFFTGAQSRKSPAHHLTRSISARQHRPRALGSLHDAMYWPEQGQHSRSSA